MIRLFRTLWPLAVALLLGASPARAACEIVGVQSILPTVMNVGSFSSTAMPPPVTVSLSVTLIVVGHGGGCKGEYGLVRLLSPARMSRIIPSPVTLPYQVTSNGGQVLSYGISASQRRRLPNFNVRNGETLIPVTLNFTVTPLAPLATPSAGSYSDQLTLQIFNREGGQRILVGSALISVTAQVVESCQLVMPGALALNFSSDVASGTPAGAVQNLSFNVNCTGSARVQLSGSALTNGTAAPSGAFDNFIDYRAVTNFGNASATLTTNGATPMTVTSPSASNLSGNNLPVSVNVNLIARRPLVGNKTYSGVLRITVDPTL